MTEAGSLRAGRVEFGRENVDVGAGEVGQTTAVAARPSDADLRLRMATRARDLDEQLSRLTRLRDSLRHAAVCDHEPIVECPDFKRAVGEVSAPAAS
ncbi:hypothetical protein [Streptomyces sp. JH34]|uniref:hypothetical protein n=1 Tax=Streptomyces sp. JH34 TaxID=2793633 RepID=UPI0023F91E25|nr:hypothetical protein [Streptomyces sp. JH34]MDF6016988.1 hypothetical protein [Streptomyces sp. JH34]